MITTDASGYCCGAVLSQLDANEEDRPVAFLSKKLSDTECNWPSHEKELYAIKLAIAKWRHYVYGSHFDVFTDNATTSDFFSSFDFTLHHRPGKTNVVADALSRPPRNIMQASTCAVHECDTTCYERYRCVNRWKDRVHDIKCLNIRTLELMMNLPSRWEEVDAPNFEVEVPHQLVINHAEKFSYSSIKMDDNFKQRFVRAYAKTKDFENEDKL
ncbi:hypothetical protein AaE_011925 [Aphanomyces astaci]|uniref:Reverse transcriptase RNase H-like domain-containing protein n=1 Tax=Aphanomyces astaci TaxID=112090 RepID=A0A6A4ZF39_APHAT|nr:hypothetical protein AaE_011925 [Aphanomyces astaci]